MSKEMHEKWMCSVDEERWQATEYFDTKEEAVKFGIESIQTFNKNPEDGCLDDEMGSTPEEVVTSFYVGQAFCPGLPFSVDDLLERVQEAAYEDGGEFAENYLDDVTKEHREELDDLIQNWFIKHKYLPNWYNIYEIDEISLS
ncbi:MAG: hypothetical protein MR320_04085 [Enterococcus gallinarum]|nr:hypothetical protein [Enterococcus gallinarum]MDY4070979.1 hypothetical protein [Enterococcus gallinarum]